MSNHEPLKESVALYWDIYKKLLAEDRGPRLNIKHAREDYFKGLRDVLVLIGKRAGAYKDKQRLRDVVLPMLAEAKRAHDEDMT